MTASEAGGYAASDSETAPWADPEEMRQLIVLVMANPEEADQLGESVGIDGRLLALQALATEAVVSGARIAELTETVAAMSRTFDQLRCLLVVAGNMIRNLQDGAVSDR